MKHLGTYRPDANGVIAASLPVGNAQFEIDLRNLAPVVDGDMCQIKFSAVSFSISFPGGMKSGSIDLFGVS